MYDYDQLMAAAAAFYQLSVITYDEYCDITCEIDHLISANDKRISFE